MESIFKAVSGKNLSNSRIANFLESKGLASELTWNPPPYVRDLPAYLKALDKEGWTEVKGKRAGEHDRGSRQSHEERTPLSIWIDGEDLNVFMNMGLHRDVKGGRATENAFVNAATFYRKYGRRPPAGNAKVRPWAELKTTRDYWRKNKQERQKMYGLWQQMLQHTEAAKAADGFSTLRKEHAAIISDMEDYRDNVSPQAIRFQLLRL